MRSLLASPALVLCLFASTATAQPAPWAEALPAVVSEHSGVNLVEQQVPLSVNTQALIAAGRLRADAADLRFASDLAGTLPIPHWIEGGVNTVNTRVWLRMPSIPANASVGIFMFIGNPAAASTSTILVFDYADDVTNSATQQTSNTFESGSADSQRGFRFTVSEDILLVNLGKFTPSDNPRTVTLFDVSTQAILEQAVVPGLTATWSYATLPAPRWLVPGPQYILEIFNPAGDDRYYFNMPPVTSPRVSYLDMRWCNGCTANTFPTNVLGGLLYGYVDFQFRTRKQASPQPTANVGAGASTTTLVASANPADFASTVTLTATVATSFAPTANIAFTVDGAVACLVPLVGGSAQCPVSGLEVGSFPVTAIYPGDAFNTGSSDGFTLQVVPVLPGAPTGISGVGGNGTATIDFVAPAFDGGGITGFTAKCSNGGIDFLQSGAAAPIVVGGLTNGTQYECGVFASNPAGDGPLSSLVPVTPITVPSAPLDLAATASDRHVVLTFQAPADSGGSPLLGYTATCSDGVGSVMAAGATAPLTVAGLINGTSYACSVLASNAVGAGPATPAVNVVPGEIAVILPTTLPVALLDLPYQVQLLASGNGTSGAFSFALIAGDPPTGLTLSASGLLDGIPTTPGSYGFTVRATDETPPPLGPYTATRAYTVQAMEVFIFFDGFEAVP